MPNNAFSASKGPRPPSQRQTQKDCITEGQAELWTLATVGNPSPTGAHCVVHCGTKERQANGLSIVLPTFNEGGSIRQVIVCCLKMDHPLEIPIVDDDSQDGTPDLAPPWPAKI